jgi:phosphatidylethanolamine/phosphatidyl-N-methylethanolamine N-methyltransferase
LAPALKKRIDISKLGGRLRPTGALADELRFLKTLIGSPKLTGAVSPSGRFLARAMAKAVGPVGDGLVVELGPGTGPVTRALIAQGVDQEQLVLVEFETEFCRLLRQRFPGARVVQGDAFALRRTLAELADRPIRAVVSSLPLLNQPSARRAALVEDAFALMAPGGVFVQFSYGVASPIRRPADAGAGMDLSRRSRFRGAGAASGEAVRTGRSPRRRMVEKGRRYAGRAKSRPRSERARPRQQDAGQGAPPLVRVGDIDFRAMTARRGPENSCAAPFRRATG